jgi:hypothetical protein
LSTLGHSVAPYWLHAAALKSASAPVHLSHRRRRQTGWRRARTSPRQAACVLFVSQIDQVIITHLQRSCIIK